MDVDEGDVELLLSVGHEGCKQLQAIAQLLLEHTPWRILGLEATATEQECMVAYRSLSLLVHPDKCPHPISVMAFH